MKRVDEGNVVSVPFTFFVQDRKFCVLLSFPVSHVRCCPDMVWITVNSTAVLIQVSVTSLNGNGLSDTCAFILCQPHSRLLLPALPSFSPPLQSWCLFFK